VGKDLAFELRLVWHGGTSILDRIESRGYDVFRARPTLGIATKAMLLAKAALGSRRGASP
jgi:hypothetical protein